MLNLPSAICINLYRPVTVDLDSDTASTVFQIENS